MSSVQAIRLRLHSGIPVMDVQGDWGSVATDAMVEMIRGLTSAGHFEIIINVQRAASEGIASLLSLSPLAQMVRAHHGHIDIVGTAEQIEHLPRSFTESLFRLATSETSAISRIKKTPITTVGPNVTASLGVPGDTRRPASE